MIDIKPYYELHLSYDNEGLKADILEHIKESSKGTLVNCSLESFECVKIITTFKELHEFILKHKDSKFIIKAD